jgi:UPF0716 protein FxsA
MPAILTFIFLILPIAELAILIKVGQAIGVFPTIFLLIGITVTGAVLVKREGMAVWRRFRAALNRGEIPSTEILDGVLVILAGALFISPGFLSDILAIVLLLPPSRAVVRRAVVRASKWFIGRSIPGAAPLNMARERVKVVKARRVAGTGTTGSGNPSDNQ